MDLNTVITYWIGIGSIIVSNAPLLVGFILPPIVEALNKDVPSEKERRYIAILISFIVAVILHWREIEVGTPEMAVAYFILIFGEQQALFKFYFQDSRLRSFIQSKVNTSWNNQVQDPITSPVN